MTNDYGMNMLRRKTLFDNYGMSGMDMNYGQAYANEPSILDLPSTRMPEIEIPDVSPGNEDLKNMRYWQSSQEQPEEESMFDQYKRQYNPETYANDRFNRFIDEAPERGEANWKDKTAAAAAYLGNRTRNIPGGQDAADRARDPDYYRGMIDWKAKAEPTYQAANLERQDNVNQRTLVGNMITADTQAKRLADTTRIADDKNRIQEAKNTAAAESARIRAEAYNYSARLGKGWDWNLSGPTAKKINKSTGEVIDTGLETGKMDEKTKIELQNEGRIEAARVTGENAAKRQENAGWDYYQTADGTTYRKNRITGEEETIPAASGGRQTRVGTSSGSGGNTANEDRGARNNRYQEVADADPGLAEKWLIPPLTANSNWSMKPPPTKGWMKFDSTYQQELAEYNRLREALGEKPISGPAATPPPVAPTGNQPIGGSNKPPTVVPPGGYNPQGRMMPPQKEPDYGPQQYGARPNPNPRGRVATPLPSEQSQAQSPLEQKAADFLRQNGQAVTPANIAAVIQRGVVR